MCKISVVVPVYNVSRYLTKNIKSILKQTFKDFELLLIDDGSSDGSGVICDELSRIDCRIKVFHTENRGVSCARNLGIKKSKGKYICFIDADDVVHEEYLEKMHNSIVVDDCDMTVCNYYRIYNNGYRVMGLNGNTSCDNVFDIICGNNLIAVWNKMFEREKIKHFFDEELEFNEDTIFCIQYYIDNNARIKFVEEPLYDYVIHGNGLTSAYHPSTITGIEKIFSYTFCLAKTIEDAQFRKQAFFYICKSYYYSIYTFIFENLAKERADKHNLKIIERIISNKKYRKILKYIIRFSFFEKKVLSKMEIAYYVASFFNSKRLVYLIARCRVYLHKEAY